MHAKLHRAVVTEANLNYIGSITISEDLIEAVGIVEGEKVQIVNNNNGNRFETYVIKGERNKGVICINGAAARLVQPGDTVIIIAYALVNNDNINSHVQKIAFLDEKNNIVELLNKETANTIR
jgi:aspartate 1-decarboxylase